MNYAYPTAWGSPVNMAIKTVFTQSFTSIVQRLAHHPSIFGWVLSNEIVWDNACVRCSSLAWSQTPIAQATRWLGTMIASNAPFTRVSVRVSVSVWQRSEPSFHFTLPPCLSSTTQGNLEGTPPCNVKEPYNPLTNAKGGQFPELYRIAKTLDPHRPCWFADGWDDGLNPALSCRNGTDPDNPYCFMDVEVAQACSSFWGMI
jgi:hypothetical protein